METAVNELNDAINKIKNDGFNEKQSIKTYAGKILEEELIDKIVNEIAYKQIEYNDSVLSKFQNINYFISKDKTKCKWKLIKETPYAKYFEDKMKEKLKSFLSSEIPELKEDEIKDTDTMINNIINTIVDKIDSISKKDDTYSKNVIDECKNNSKKIIDLFKTFNKQICDAIDNIINERVDELFTHYYNKITLEFKYYTVDEFLSIDVDKISQAEIKDFFKFCMIDFNLSQESNHIIKLEPDAEEVYAAFNKCEKIFEESADTFIDGINSELYDLQQGELNDSQHNDGISNKLYELLMKLDCIKNIDKDEIMNNVIIYLFKNLQNDRDNIKEHIEMAIHIIDIANILLDNVYDNDSDNFE